MNLKELLEKQEFYVNESGKFATEITLERLNMLIDKLHELQNNWNELKQWLDPKGWDERFLFLDTILEKMQELEGNND